MQAGRITVCQLQCALVIPFLQTGMHQRRAQFAGVRQTMQNGTMPASRLGLPAYPAALRELAQQGTRVAFTAQRNLSHFSDGGGLWHSTIVLIKPLILSDFLKLAHGDIPEMIRDAESVGRFAE